MSKTYKMILVALFAAFTAVGGFFKIPLPFIPFTLQLFFVIFAGLLLGAKLGFASQAIYIAIGLSGIPVFASGGGLGYIFNPSFGYLIGFAVTAYVVGYLSQKLTQPTLVKLFMISLVGLMVTYIIGVPYFYMILKYINHSNKTISYVLTTGFLSCLPLDIVKIFAASWLAKEIYPRINPVAAQNI